MRKEIEGIAELLKSKDINEYAIDELPGIIVAAATGTPVDQAMAFVKIGKDITNLPTYIFWFKMGRYLKGTFHNIGDQLKLAARFNQEDGEYEKFVERVVYTINQIDVTDKVDFFANLTRAFLLELIDKNLFFKLTKYLLMCTLEELQFIAEHSYSFESFRNTVMISALYQYGLFIQSTKENSGDTIYILSDFAKALKQNCLNIEEGIGSVKRLSSYSDMEPLPISESITREEIDDMLVDNVWFEDTGDDGGGRLAVHRGKV